MMLITLVRYLYTNQSTNLRKLVLIYQEEKGALAAALAQRIQRELKEAHFHAMETDTLVDSAQVPYTVIITNRTLSDGVVHLKHFKPKINEEVHVSNLTERLLLQAGAVTLRSS